MRTTEAREFVFECVPDMVMRECITIGTERVKAGDLPVPAAGCLWVCDAWPVTERLASGSMRVRVKVVCLPIDDVDAFGWIRHEALHRSEA